MFDICWKLLIKSLERPANFDIVQQYSLVAFAEKLCGEISSVFYQIKFFISTIYLRIRKFEPRRENWICRFYDVILMTQYRHGKLMKLKRSRNKNRQLEKDTPLFLTFEISKFDYFKIRFWPSFLWSWPVSC